MNSLQIFLKLKNKFKNKNKTANQQSKLSHQ